MNIFLFIIPILIVTVVLGIFYPPTRKPKKPTKPYKEEDFEKDLIDGVYDDVDE